MKSKPQQQQHQQQNKKSNPNSKFVRTRNQNEDIPMSASKIKKRIRDVKRTLSKGKQLSAEVLTESKRRLRVLEFDLGERMVDEVERGNATKYHKVKHFERKKTERKIRQAKKELAEESDVSKKAKLQEKVDLHELHLLYITHYPKTMPYVSLYPQENANDSKSVARKESILKDIKDALLKGDSDLKLFNQHYRNAYKDKMIAKGIIPAITPVAVDEDVTKDKSGSGTESESEDEKDDFFDKA